jgi:hypothetical protein
MKATVNNYYRLSPDARRRLLADVGFVRDLHGIWAHPDGRAIGESVATALTDASLLRYLGLDASAIPVKNRRRKRKGKGEWRK